MIHGSGDKAWIAGREAHFAISSVADAVYCGFRFVNGGLQTPYGMVALVPDANIPSDTLYIRDGEIVVGHPVYEKANAKITGVVDIPFVSLNPRKNPLLTPA